MEQLRAQKDGDCMYPNSPGVYCFWCKLNSCYYIGATGNLARRINQHKKKSHNHHLAKLIAWAGLDHFNITYLEFETKEQAFAYEQVLLDYAYSQDEYCRVLNTNNKPLYIKSYPSGEILYKVKSNNDAYAQHLLNLNRRKINSLLAGNATNLFRLTIDGTIIYLEYADETLEYRAYRFNRCVEFDFEAAQRKRNRFLKTRL